MNMRIIGFAKVVLFTLFSLGSSGWSQEADQMNTASVDQVPMQSGTRIVRMDVHHDVSPAVRDLPVVIGTEPTMLEAEPLRLIPLPPGLKSPEEPDPVLQQTTTSTPAMLSPGTSLNFDGLGQGVFGFQVSVAPPDTNGAVGLTQYVQSVNLSFAVFDKETGALIKGPVSGNSLWQGFGGGCEFNKDGDPIVT